MLTSKESLKEREREFTEALARWRSNNLDKEAWDIMYYRIYDCCHNISAKMLKGVRTDPDKFDDRVLDSTLYVLERILKGTDPQKLSSYCYLVCKGRLFGPKQQFEDRKIQYVPELFQYIEKEVYDEYDEEDTTTFIKYEKPKKEKPPKKPRTWKIKGESKMKGWKASEEQRRKLSETQTKRLALIRGNRKTDTFIYIDDDGEESTVYQGDKVI